MNYISKHLTVAAILLSAICANAQESVAAAPQSAAAPTATQANPAATALANAQKSYVSGNWKDAAAAYEKACPQQPKEKQAECLLWNVLALSQTGDATSFKKAGKRLDSLIQKVNPQESLYADLLMTSAQFRLYLGKYDLAAQDLVHAIETSQPHHNVVLQKVCAAVKAKTNNETLNERCELLKQPESLAALQKNMKDSSAAPIAVEQTAPVTAPATATAQMTAQAAPAPQAAPAVQAPSAAQTASAPQTEQKPAEAKTAEQPAPAVQSVSAEAASKPIQQEVPKVPAPAAAATDKPAEEYWILQLGAYSVKAYADLMVNNLKKQKIACTIVEQPRGDKILYLVQTGHFATKEAAIDFAADKLVKQKIEYQPLLRK